MNSETSGNQLAIIGGSEKANAKLIPADLYIPPDALIVILQAFTGPLDLLLYLIRRQNLDILDIPIAEVTKQYMAYIEMMTTMRLELAGDYLVMSATLAEIKSSMLLPRPRELEEEEEDPRAKLVRRLLEYEAFKSVAEDLDKLPRMERDIFPVQATFDSRFVKAPAAPVELKELTLAFSYILERVKLNQDYEVNPEPLSVEEHMDFVLDRIRKTTEYLAFHDFFDEAAPKDVVVVTFLAILELVKTGHIVLVQHEPFAPIFLGGKRD